MAATISETHEFTVGERAALDIRNRAGNVTVAAGPAGQVRVVVTKRARGLFGGADESDLERLHVAVIQSGDTIHIDAERGEHWTLLKQVSVDLEITAPATNSVDLRLNAGNVRLAGITGSVRAELNAGNFDLTDVTCTGASRLTLNAGTLTLRGALAAGASLDARVNAGNARFTLPAGAAVAIEARTTAGAIHTSAEQLHVSRQFASATASGQLGPATSSSPGASLRAQVDAGNITLDVE
jgi:hypothetical protein